MQGIEAFRLANNCEKANILNILDIPSLFFIILVIPEQSRVTLPTTH